MFDWDKDYSTLIAGRAVPAPDDDKPDSPAQAIIIRLRRFFVPLGLCGLFLAAVAYEKLDPSRISPSAALDGPALAQVADMLPPQMEVYDLQQFHRFTNGLRQMSAPDLLTYKINLQRELGAASAFMAPFHRDALFLLQAEIARRGV